MIEIKIDYNNDKVTCLRDEKPYWEFSNVHMKQIEKIIYEVLNTLYNKLPVENVRLSKIDEDTETTIDEW